MGFLQWLGGLTHLDFGLGKSWVWSFGGSGGSRKIFQSVQRSLQNLNITSLKKKKYMKFYKILLRVFIA
jgi:hypothetical protein